MKIFTLKNKPVKAAVFYIIIFFFWIGLWKVLSLLIGKEVLMPAPEVVAKRLFVLCGESAFWLAVLNSVLHITIGMFVGVLAGVILAVIGYCSHILLAFSSPILSIVKTTPVASFIILALIWISRDYVPMFVSCLMVTPLIWQNTLTGLKNLSPQLKEVCIIHRIPMSRQIRLLYIPGTLPYFRAGFQTAMGFAWKAGIAAEVLTTPRRTLGKMLYDSKTYLETVDVFALTTVVILLSFLFEKLFIYLFKRTERHQKFGGVPVE